MSPSAALAAIPVLGGASLFFGGGAAIIIDRVQVKRAEKQRAERMGRAPHPVLIRYLSAAIVNPYGWPHHVFLAAVTVYAVCVCATAGLQAQLMAARDGECPGTTSKACPAAWPLIVYAAAGGVSGVLMAVFTHGHPVFKGDSRRATLFHCVFASCFIGFSVSYGASTVPLAVALGGEGSATAENVKTARIAFAIACGVGCVWNLLLAGAAAYGTVVLVQHEVAEEAAVVGAVPAALSGETALPPPVVVRVVPRSSQPAEAATAAADRASGGGGAGTGLADQHQGQSGEPGEPSQSRPPQLTAQQVWKIRAGETALACGQILAGASVSALTALGAAEMLL